MDKWLINGIRSDSVSVMDRGLQYGDGLFETIAVRNGSLRFLDYHLDRLNDGCRRLAIPFPTGATIENEVRNLSADCRFGTAKILLTRGIGKRGYAPPDNPIPNRLIGLLEGVRPSRAPYETGVVVRFCDTNISANPTLAGIKSLGRLDQVLARCEWTDATISDGLMSTQDGKVICGTMTNLFFVTGGELTNSLVGIWPVVRLEATDYQIGPCTRRLMAGLAGLGVTECAA
jgi:4-amino-4-deoxychorismate lyase